MSLLGNIVLKRIYKSAGSYIKGRWVSGIEEEQMFEGSVQPTNGKDMQLLPEGKRSNETVKIYATANIPFTSADESNKVEGDIIEYNGKQYEVVTVKKWSNGLIPNTYLLCVRKNEVEE